MKFLSKKMVNGLFFSQPRVKSLTCAAIMFACGSVSIGLSGCSTGSGPATGTPSQNPVQNPVDPTPSRSLAGQWAGSFTSPPNALIGSPTITGSASISISSGNAVSVTFLNPGGQTYFSMQGTINSAGKFTGNSTGIIAPNPLTTEGNITENSTGRASTTRQITFSFTVHGSLTPPYSPDADLNFTGTATLGSTQRSINACVNSFNLGGSGGGTSLTSGDPGLDTFVAQQGSQLNTFWQLPIQYDFIDDSQSPNAYSEQSAPRIHIGRRLFVETAQSYGTLAALGILAHEFGHQVQRVVAPGVFQGANQDPLITRQEELEADAFSGFYLAFTQNTTWDSVRGYYANTYNHGNYDYTNPGWHGSGQNRLDATLLGVNTAIYARTYATYPTVYQLHDIFYNVTYRSVHGGRAANVFTCPPEQRDFVIKALEYLSKRSPANE